MSLEDRPFDVIIAGRHGDDNIEWSAICEFYKINV